MTNVPRLPTKFGQGHTDSIAFFQDEVLPSLINNKIVCLALRGFLEDGTELDFTIVDGAGGRGNNTRLLGQIVELQSILMAELRAQAAK